MYIYLWNMQSCRVRLFVADHNRTIDQHKSDKGDQHQTIRIQMSDQQFDLAPNEIITFAVENQYVTNVLKQYAKNDVNIKTCAVFVVVITKTHLKRIHVIRLAIPLVALDKWQRLRDDLIDDRRPQHHGHPHDVRLAHQDSDRTYIEHGGMFVLKKTTPICAQLFTCKRGQMMLVLHVEQQQRQNGRQRQHVRVIQMGKEVERRQHRPAERVPFRIRRMLIFYRLRERKTNELDLKCR